jgi:hypothetical protein
MFTIDSEARITPYPQNAQSYVEAEHQEWQHQVTSRAELAGLIQTHPGEWAVKLWNQLPRVIPILTPKFRNRATATERIWNRLAELYSDAILADMPKKRERHAKAAAKAKAVVPRAKVKTPMPARASVNGAGRKSRWAEELTEALRKRFNPGDSFELQDVYKLIPQFQKRHPANKNIAARLRATLAQDLRGSGVVKSSAKGKYRLSAA